MMIHGFYDLMIKGVFYEIKKDNRNFNMVLFYLQKRSMAYG